MDTNQKGALAEVEIAAAATRLGIPVLRPIVEHGRTDLGFEISGRLLRVQCKWASLDTAQRVVRVRTGGSRCTPHGYVLSTYRSDEIDLLAAYCGELDCCYLLPGALVADRRMVQLRLEPPLNGQRACINLAADYLFDGAVAQLEERPAGSRQVGGSSPPSSTSSDPSPHVTEVGAHQFRNHFGYYLERAAAGDEIRVSRHGRKFVKLSRG